MFQILIHRDFGNLDIFDKFNSFLSFSYIFQALEDELWLKMDESRKKEPCGRKILLYEKCIEVTGTRIFH